LGEAYNAVSLINTECSICFHLLKHWGQIHADKYLFGHRVHIQLIIVTGFFYKIHFNNLTKK